MPVLVSPVTGSGQPVGGTGNLLVSLVARIAGGESEPSIRAQALSCLNRIRIRLNRRQWRFTKTTQPAITLSNTVQTYSLLSAFSRPSTAELLDTSSKPYSNLEYQDDAIFLKWNQPQQQTGEPRFYTLRNAFGDGLISLYPVPNSTAASNYTLSVEYYARIGTIVDDPTAPTYPEEVNDVLVSGGQWLLMSERVKHDVQGIAFKKAEHDEALQSLISWDRRITDERARFRMGPRRVPLGSIYIRVD